MHRPVKALSPCLNTNPWLKGQCAGSRPVLCAELLKVDSVNEREQKEEKDHIQDGFSFQEGLVPELLSLGRESC